MTELAELSIKVEIDDEKFQKMIEDFKRNNPNFVEVVRCKECKHEDDEIFCPIYSYYFFDKEDFFCRFGERKDNVRM